MKFSTKDFFSKCVIFIFDFKHAKKYSEKVAQRRSVKNVFLKFRKIHRKMPISESLFNKVAGLRLKKETQTHLAAASEY